jgi:hypothetical protein
MRFCHQNFVGVQPVDLEQLYEEYLYFPFMSL